MPSAGRSVRGWRMGWDRWANWSVERVAEGRRTCGTPSAERWWGGNSIATGPERFPKVFWGRPNTVRRQQGAQSLRTLREQETFEMIKYATDYPEMISAPPPPPMFMRSALFWNITQRRLVFLCQRFGTTCRSYIQGARSLRRRGFLLGPLWPLKMGPIRCAETSVKDYHITLRNIEEERRSQTPHISCNPKFHRSPPLFPIFG
jgi:hypothetical protein